VRAPIDDTLLLRRFRSQIPASAADPSQRLVEGRAAFIGFNQYRTRTLARIASITASQELLIANDARAWLLIQNRGPGNLYVNYGVSGDLTNSIVLVATAAQEFIGGGPGGAFVPSESVWAFADAANTIVVVGEGVFLPPGTPGV
jgi:hypothetical protein